MPEVAAAPAPPGVRKGALRRIDAGLAKAEGWLLVVSLLGILALGVVQIILRLFHITLDWGDEVMRNLTLWIVRVKQDGARLSSRDSGLRREGFYRIGNIFRAALEKHAAAFSQGPKGNLALLEIIRWRDRRQRHREQCYQSHGFASLTNAFVHLTFILCRIASAVKRL